MKTKPSSPASTSSATSPMTPTTPKMHRTPPRPPAHPAVNQIQNAEILPLFHATKRRRSACSEGAYIPVGG